MSVLSRQMQINLSFAVAASKDFPVCLQNQLTGHAQVHQQRVWIFRQFEDQQLPTATNFRK